METNNENTNSNENTAEAHFNFDVTPVSTTQHVLTSLAFGAGMAFAYVSCRLLARRLADSING